jgi:CHASE1-domain containing sensor protein
MEIEEDVIKVDASGKVHYFHWLFVTLSAVVTIVSWYITKTQIDEKIKIQFDREADQVIELISERMRKYEDALWGGVSTIQSHGGDISYESWLTFSESLRIDTKYPGISGIGVIHNLQKSELENYLNIQQKSRKNFKIHPKHYNSEYWPITYIEPSKTNMKAVGLDMAHENNRYTAALKARDTGKAQITGPIVLVQDSDRTPGFLFYAPFLKAKKRSTLKDRRENVVGLVYAPFVVKKLMEGVLEKSRRRVGIHINDKEDVLYEEHTSSNSDYDSNFLFQKLYEVEYYGRVWSFDIRSTLSFRDSIINHQAKII